MPDYNQGKIYTIRNKNDDTLIYVGSTTTPLCKRWYNHKNNCFKENYYKYNYIIYQKMRETNIDDWYIELYENYSCNCKNELNRREGEIIRLIGTLNKMIAGRTMEEWRFDNKEHIKQYSKTKSANYYLENADKIKERVKEYKLANAEKVKEANKLYLERKKTHGRVKY